MSDASQAERQAAHYVQALIREYLGLDYFASPAVEMAGVEPDVILNAPGGLPSLVIEAKSGTRLPQLRQAAERAQTYAQIIGAVPVVVAPYVSPNAARALRELGVSFVDLSGNADLRAGTLALHVEGKPNRFPDRGRPSSAFASRSARVSRMLLLDPVRWWKQVDLVRETHLASGTVSKVVARLDEDDLLDRRSDGALRPRVARGLLEAWADEYRFDRHRIVRGHAAVGGGPRLAHDVAKQLESQDVRYAVTRLPAAWLLDGFAQFRMVSIFVEADPEQVIGEMLRGRVEGRGANIEIVQPDDSGVFDGSNVVDGVSTVAPVQAYLDLLQGPERSAEAAEHLLATRLDWPG